MSKIYRTRCDKSLLFEPQNFKNRKTFFTVIREEIFSSSCREGELSLNLQIFHNFETRTFVQDSEHILKAYA